MIAIDAGIDQGAPLKGANSFTEGQAKDRAIAHGEVDSVAGLKKDDDGIWRGTGTQAEFMDACKADVYAPRKADEGAPLKGANSFTEGQAKDRAIGHGGVDAVADLKKDDDGIWRGTGTQAGKTVEIAVDYKGNVVTKAQQ